MRRLVRLTMLTYILVLSAGTALAQFELDWYTVDGGGAMFSTGGAFELGGTIGQPDANTTPMAGGTFELVGAFGR